MNKKGYPNKILEIIKSAKSVHNWSISDYLDPVREFYPTLSPKDKRAFCSSLITLLQGKNYLSDVITICTEIRLKEACPVLIKLFLNPPRRLKEDSFYIGTKGVRVNALVALGKMRCSNARLLLRDILEIRMLSKKTKFQKFDDDLYGSMVVALANISPSDAAKYFGWWIEKDQQLTRQIMAHAKQTDDWKEMERLAIALPIDERSSAFIQDCILAVAKRRGLRGLKKWLRAVCLPKEDDRDYLRYQLEYMLTGKNPLSDLKIILHFTGDAQSLARELADLPSVGRKILGNRKRSS